MIFDKYPYSNFHEMNDDWIIKTLREFDQKLDEFVAANSLTYADPIEYDPDAIYAANTVVIYDNAAYVSKQAAPAGMLPTNADYWLMIFPFGDLIDSAVEDMETRIDEALAAAQDQLETAINGLPTLVNAWMAAHPDVVSAVPANSVNWQKLTPEMRAVILADYEKEPTQNIVFTEQGGLHGSGTEYASAEACRTGFLQFPAGVMVLELMAGYIVTVFRYDADGDYINHIYLGSAINPAVGLLAVAVAAGEQYRFEIMIDGITQFTPADLPSGVLTFVPNVSTNVSIDEFDELVLDRYGRYMSRNLVISEESLTSGYMSKNGNTAASNSYSYTEYLPVSAGDVLQTYYKQAGIFAIHSFRYICCFDAFKNVLTAKGTDSGTTSFTVPDDVHYIRATLYNDANKTEHAVTLNCSIQAYHAYEAPTRTIERDFLSPESQEIIAELQTGNLSSTHLRNSYYCSLPRQALKQTIGIPESFYYWCAMFPPATTYGYASAGAQYCTKHNDKITFDNNTPLTSVNGYNWYMYDAAFAQIDAYTGNAGLGGPRSIMAENLSDCSLLAIGDSTVDHDTMTASLLSHFTAQGHTLTLLGTLGSGANKNEGRSGWKVSDYLTNKQYQGVVNPFYNPSTQTFDFAYYMTNQQYAAVDFVVLQMGINDISSGADAAAIWTNLKIIIDSILDFDSTIRILLNLPTTPNSNQSLTSAFLMGYLKAVCEYDEYVLAHVLSEYTATNVRTSYSHLILDPDTEINDNVHPTTAGYEKMALEIVNQVNHWQNND